MAFEAAGGSSSVSGAGTTTTGASVIARQDRIPIWSLSYLFIGIIGVGFLFTFLNLFHYSPLSLSATKPAYLAAPACILVHALA